MKKRLNAIIVVEGKNDVSHLSQWIDADFVTTNGLGLNEERLDQIEELSKNREVIFFLDPDGPGETIRRRLLERIPHAKQAFLAKEDALGKHKVGVEHANQQAILEALNDLVDGKEREESISYSDYYELGFMGRKNSKELRMKCAKKLHLGYGDAKSFYKWLNRKGVTKEELEKVLEDVE